MLQIPGARNCAGRAHSRAWEWSGSCPAKAASPHGRGASKRAGRPPQMEHLLQLLLLLLQPSGGGAGPVQARPLRASRRQPFPASPRAGTHDARTRAPPSLARLPTSLSAPAQPDAAAAAAATAGPAPASLLLLLLLLPGGGGVTAEHARKGRRVVVGLGRALWPCAERAGAKQEARPFPV